VDRDPEERREETRQEREEREAASGGREGDRRRREVPTEPETPAGLGMREESPHEEERPEEGLERPWWRRVFGG
jgi:hypothetical protein